jgi:hypothetical protein
LGSRIRGDAFVNEKTISCIQKNQRMSTTIYNGPVIKDSDLKTYVFFWAMAIVCLVYFAVVYYVGESGPDAMEASLPYVAVAGIGFTIIGFVLYAKSKSHLEILSTGDQRFSFVLMAPDKRIPVEFYSPFTVEYGWNKEYIKGTHTKHLYLAFFDQHGTNVLTLKTILGGAYSAPNWPELAAAKTGGYKQVYLCNSTQELVKHFS